jgi:hypothetical protein
MHYPQVQQPAVYFTHPTAPVGQHTSLPASSENNPKEQHSRRSNSGSNKPPNPANPIPQEEDMYKSTESLPKKPVAFMALPLRQYTAINKSLSHSQLSLAQLDSAPEESTKLKETGRLSEPSQANGSLSPVSPRKRLGGSMKRPPEDPDDPDDTNHMGSSGNLLAQAEED